MMGRKRKIMVSNEGSLGLASHWVEFQNQIKGIKPRRCTAWVYINGVPGLGGVTEAVHWREVLSSGVSPVLEALKLGDPDHFFVGGLHQNVRAWDDILESHPLAERIGRWIRDKMLILEFARPFSAASKTVSEPCVVQIILRFYISGNYSSCYYRSFQVWGKLVLITPPPPPPFWFCL